MIHPDLADLKAVSVTRLIQIRNDLATMLDSVEQHAEGGDLVGYALSLPSVHAVLQDLVSQLDALVEVEECSSGRGISRSHRSHEARASCRFFSLCTFS